MIGQAAERNQRLPSWTAVVRITAVALVGYLLTFHPPFRLADRTNEGVQDLIVAATAPFFSLGRTSLADEPAVVVMVDQRSINAMNDALAPLREEWHAKPERCREDYSGPEYYDCDMPLFREYPIPYVLHDYLLAEIIRMEPAAVVVNIVFQNRRDWDPGLASFGTKMAEAQDELGEDPIPVFLPLGGAASATPGSALEMLTQNTGGKDSFIIPVETRWLSQGGLYPVKVLRTKSDGKVGSGTTAYSSVLADPRRRLAGVEPLDSLAVQVYRTLCQSDTGETPSAKRACGGARASQAFEDWVNQDNPGGFMVRWRTGAPNGLTNFRSLRDTSLPPEQWCKEAPKKRVSAALRGLAIFGSNVINFPFANNASAYDPCPAHVRINSAMFFPPGDLGIGNVFDAVEGAVVFYSILVDQAPNKATSPVHGSIPRADFHASAYDNLVQYEGDVFRAYPELIRIAGIFIFLTYLCLEAWRILSLDKISNAARSYHACVRRLPVGEGDRPHQWTSRWEAYSEYSAVEQAQHAESRRIMRWATALAFAILCTCLVLFIWVRVAPFDLFFLSAVGASLPALSASLSRLGGRIVWIACALGSTLGGFLRVCAGASERAAPMARRGATLQTLSAMVLVWHQEGSPISAPLLQPE